MIYHRASFQERPFHTDPADGTGRGRAGLRGLGHASLTASCVLAAVLSLSVALPAAADGQGEQAIDERVGGAVEYLASDALEGRGIGSKGIDLAAEFIAAEFASAGLVTSSFDGTAFQKFEARPASKLGPAAENRLALIKPSPDNGDEARRVDLKFKAQFTPLALGGAGTFDLPLVFGGYGITAPDADYDDYTDVDVKGKAVLIVRKEPQQQDKNSKFNGAKPSRHATFENKVANAIAHGVAALVIVNDGLEVRRRASRLDQGKRKAEEQLAAATKRLEALQEPSEEELEKHRLEVQKWKTGLSRTNEQLEAGVDSLLPFTGAGDSGHDLPILFATRGAVEPMVMDALGVDLETIETQIDRDLKPFTKEFSGWRVAGQTSLTRKKMEVKNVVGVLEGQGPLAEETIVVGAHYDHLGYGGPGSRSPGVHAIHPGADDNASGVAGVIEIARQLAGRDEPLPRRVVFIAFTGEERGLWGSKHYVANPLVPLGKTVAMVNLDMVGRLQEARLTVFGTGTATEFDRLVDSAGKSQGLTLNKRASGFSGSDHLSFVTQKIPVLHLFSGGHGDYHKPEDVYAKINAPGIGQVARFAADVVAGIAQLDAQPTYQKTARPKMATMTRDRPIFGVVPDLAKQVEGFAIATVLPGTPAKQAGILDGDIVTRFGEAAIKNLGQFQKELVKYKAGGEVETVVQRNGEELTVKVKLAPVKR